MNTKFFSDKNRAIFRLQEMSGSSAYHSCHRPSAQNIGRPMHAQVHSGITEQQHIACQSCHQATTVFGITWTKEKVKHHSGGGAVGGMRRDEAILSSAVKGAVVELVAVQLVADSRVMGGAETLHRRLDDA